MTPREQRIRERAYQLWVQAGRPDDRHVEFWNIAEEQINREEGKEPDPLPPRGGF
jgi:hypothetical protein